MSDPIHTLARCPTRLEIRREKVTSAARALFAQFGFHATGIAQIAASSDVKVQQIYRDFGNKEAIVAAIVERDVALLLSDLPEGETYSDLEALRGWLLRTLQASFAHEHPPLFLEIFAEASRNKRIATILRAVDHQVLQALTAVFACFSHIDTATSAARLFLTFFAGLSARSVADPDLDPDAFIKMIAEMIVHHVEA